VPRQLAIASRLLAVGGPKRVLNAKLLLVVETENHIDTGAGEVLLGYHLNPGVSHRDPVDRVTAKRSDEPRPQVSVLGESGREALGECVLVSLGELEQFDEEVGHWHRPPLRTALRGTADRRPSLNGLWVSF